MRFFFVGGKKGLSCFLYTAWGEKVGQNPNQQKILGKFAPNECTTVSPQAVSHYIDWVKPYRNRIFFLNISIVDFYQIHSMF